MLPQGILPVEYKGEQAASGMTAQLIRLTAAAAAKAILPAARRPLLALALAPSD
jgi:hypothetical protein